MKSAGFQCRSDFRGGVLDHRVAVRKANNDSVCRKKALDMRDRGGDEEGAEI